MKSTSLFIDGCPFGITSHGRRGKRSLWGIFYQGNNSIKALSSWLNHLPRKGLPSTTNTSGVRFNMNRNIQSTAFYPHLLWGQQLWSLNCLLSSWTRAPSFYSDDWLISLPMVVWSHPSYSLPKFPHSSQHGWAENFPNLLSSASFLINSVF